MPSTQLSSHIGTIFNTIAVSYKSEYLIQWIGYTSSMSINSWFKMSKTNFNKSRRYFIWQCTNDSQAGTDSSRNWFNIYKSQHADIVCTVWPILFERIMRVGSSKWTESSSSSDDNDNRRRRRRLRRLCRRRRRRCLRRRHHHYRFIQGSALVADFRRDSHTDFLNPFDRISPTISVYSIRT